MPRVTRASIITAANIGRLIDKSERIIRRSLYSSYCILSLFSKDQGSSCHEQHNSDHPLAIQRNHPEPEQTEMVQQDAGSQLSAYDRSHGRGSADPRDGNNGHGYEKGAEKPAGKLPPLGICKPPE